ncbi:MAG: O-antigen ligase family protein [Veillonellales bacterium]
MKIIYQSLQARYDLDYLIEYCILAVTFFLPISLTITSAFLAAGTLLWVGKMVLLRRMNLKRTPFDKIIILLVLLSAASILGSPDWKFSLYNYSHLMGRYLLLYYFVINNIHSMEQVKRLILVLLGAAAAITVYGFYQYLFGAAASAGEWVDTEQFPDLKFRVFSTLENPNLLAGFLVTMMSLAAGIGCTAAQWRKKLLWFGLVMLFGVCLALTYCRGAWISLLATVIVYGILYNRKIFWLLLFIPLLAFTVHDVFLERLVSILNPTDTSATLRFALWESTLAMIRDHPLFGIGWGAYWLVYPQYDFFINDASTKIVHAHNMYLNIAAEIGIPGFLAFLTILFGHVRRALTILAATADRWTAGIMLGILSSVAGLLVSGFTDYVMFNIQMSMLFWLLNALVVIVWQRTYMCGINTKFVKRL